jgi:L-2,4-diaminobutyric acid acetyltransferase
MDKGLLFIWQICVHKDHRGRGVASLLLDSLFTTAREHGFEKLELSISESNNASMNLFRSYSEKNNLTMQEMRRYAFGNITEIVFEISLV